MNYSNYGCGFALLCLVSLIHADVTDNKIESILHTADKQEAYSEEIDTSDLPPAIRQFPQLVDRIQVERLATTNQYVLLPHKPNYVLPFTWQTQPSDKEVNEMLENITGIPGENRGPDGYEHMEMLFQFSLKVPVADGVFGRRSRIDLAYTNRSFWQAYNTKISRPFRETNHEPEIIFSWLTDKSWVDYFSLSLNHQSNGQTSSMSRSWNRVIGETATIFPVGILRVRVWWRMPEKSSSEPLDPSDDDNPDIEHYMGPGDVSFILSHGRNTFSIMARNNFNINRNKGAIELGYKFPLTARIKGYVQYFNGYGESLIDYDRSQQRFGIGIALSDWM